MMKSVEQVIEEPCLETQKYENGVNGQDLNLHKRMRPLFMNMTIIRKFSFLTLIAMC